MRALVTGAGGFVGRYLVDHLLEQGDEVLGITRSRSGTPLACKTEYFDIGDLDACRQAISAYKPDAIYHLAGMAFVPEAEEDFEKALKVNVLGTSNIYRVTHLLERPTRILLISSSEVYGKIKPAQLPINEKTQIAPANNYSLSKAMAELVSTRYSDSASLTNVIIRPFNHIGPGQNARFVVSNFARQLALIKLNKAPAKISVGNLEARRDFTDVRDIVRAYRLAAVSGRGLYNFASGKSISIRSILDLLIMVSGIKVDVKPDPTRIRASDTPELFADISKAKAELGWEPEFEIRNTLEDIFKYWVEQEGK